LEITPGENKVENDPARVTGFPLCLFSLCLSLLFLCDIFPEQAPDGVISVPRPQAFMAGSKAVNVKGRAARPEGREACLSASLRADTGIESKATRQRLPLTEQPIPARMREQGTEGRDDRCPRMAKKAKSAKEAVRSYCRHAFFP
jgi:hypothetical protein